MRVLYDHQIFSVQKYGGISRYFYEISRGIKASDVDVSVIFSNNIYISRDEEYAHCRLPDGIDFLGKSKIISFINSLFSSYRIKKGSWDVFHPTYYDRYFIKYLDGRPFVLTVYDMIHEKYPEYFSKRDKTSINKKILCDKASKIIAISESTKKDIIDIFKIDESKIEVIHLASSLKVSARQQRAVDLPDKYILFVGVRSGYKNFYNFMHAIVDILDSDSQLYVFCVGGGHFTNNEIFLFRKYGLENRFIQKNIDDNTLADVYNRAELFVFPSLYEGFGMPILEAFACKCPVVCSNTSSLPEIASDAAQYFDPHSVSSIKYIIKEVLQNHDLRQLMVVNGQNRERCFSWNSVIRNTYGVYADIMK